MAHQKKAPTKRQRKTTEVEAFRDEKAPTLARDCDDWEHRRRVQRSELLADRGIVRVQPRRPPQQQVVSIDRAAREELALEALEDVQLQVEVLRDALVDPSYSPEEIEERARAMLRAAKDVRPDGADPRMVLTEQILSYAALMHDSPWPEAGAKALAQLTAGKMRELYSALRRRMREPSRVDAIRLAILASRKRPSWAAIVACWDGVEAVPLGTETWRAEWKRFRPRRRPKS